MYEPKPMDLQDVKLPQSLEELMEQIAENVHENWAKSRMDQGWVLGPERSDVDKTHPCLIPYDELPEVEKDYDRQTATQTLKLILALGYSIEKTDK